MPQPAIEDQKHEDSCPLCSRKYITKEIAYIDSLIEKYEGKIDSVICEIAELLEQGRDSEAISLFNMHTNSKRLAGNRFELLYSENGYAIKREKKFDKYSRPYFQFVTHFNIRRYTAH